MQDAFDPAYGTERKAPIIARGPAPIIASRRTEAGSNPPRQAGQEDSGPAAGRGVSAAERTRAERLIGDIGSEFNLLRKKGRSAAWASLEEKVAEGGSLLIATGMITMKDWTGMLIDIEQFRKAEGGSEEMPGDALAKWLSEAEPKIRRSNGRKEKEASNKRSETEANDNVPENGEQEEVTA